MKSLLTGQDQFDEWKQEIQALMTSKAWCDSGWASFSPPASLKKTKGGSTLAVFELIIMPILSAMIGASQLLEIAIVWKI